MEEILNLLYKKHSIECVFLLLTTFICKLKELLEHPVSLGGVIYIYMYVSGRLAGLGLKFTHHNLTSFTLFLKIKLLEGFEMG